MESNEECHTCMIHTKHTHPLNSNTHLRSLVNLLSTTTTHKTECGTINCMVSPITCTHTPGVAVTSTSMWCVRHRRYAHRVNGDLCKILPIKWAVLELENVSRFRSLCQFMRASEAYCHFSLFFTDTQLLRWPVSFTLNFKK